MEHEEAFLIYHNNFRGYKEIFSRSQLSLFSCCCFSSCSAGLPATLRKSTEELTTFLEDDESKICLSREMLPFQCKLNTVKRNLRQQKEATALAEQRKDELVMYLAHDIRTPLTSVIGYLSLLEEAPDMTVSDRTKKCSYRFRESIPAG